MSVLLLHELHRQHGARFLEVGGCEAVADYGDFLVEHRALRESAAALDLSFRSRLCLTGADRERFLNGQVTNNVKALRPGAGCYAALITAKGKLQSDLNIYRLEDELLLDFEPGLAGAVTARFEKYIIADDVQVVDASPHYGLLSVQGPKAEEALARLGLECAPPPQRSSWASAKDDALGEVYLMNQPRTGSRGFDLFAPVASLSVAAERLFEAVKAVGGRSCGWQALEVARLEAGIPRYGVDMDESNLAPEAGIEERAISYTKGCYIGQEVIARLRTYGEVAKALRGLRLADDLPQLPEHGDVLLKSGKEVGYITSATVSPDLNANLALGYVRKEVNQVGNELTLRTAGGESVVRIVELPFR